jgi:hypothetical protein
VANLKEKVTPVIRKLDQAIFGNPGILTPLNPEQRKQFNDWFSGRRPKRRW